VLTAVKTEVEEADDTTGLIGMKGLPNVALDWYTGRVAVVAVTALLRIKGLLSGTPTIPDGLLGTAGLNRFAWPDKPVGVYSGIVGSYPGTEICLLSVGTYNV
jgi:hypothetical protein